jgi:hypothetical protein
MHFRNTLLNTKRKNSVAFFCLSMFLAQWFFLGFSPTDAVLARGSFPSLDLLWWNRNCRCLRLLDVIDRFLSAHQLRA